MLLAESLLGSSSTAANYIEDVFSTYLYTGNSSTQTISNGIDLSTKGGMVWAKRRDAVANHVINDTARGASQTIYPNLTNAQQNDSPNGISFNTNGFTVGALNSINTNNAANVSWTFRKQAKFFDVVTYTGNGANRTIAHNLGSVPGCIIVKCTSDITDWGVYHRSLTSAAYALQLNTTGAQFSNVGYWNSTAPTSSVFSVGTDNDTNANGRTYVAYLFAHDAGGFGASGSDNVISCGSFTTDGSGNATVSLGYEPQWVLVKRTNTAEAWQIIDNMRGWPITPAANNYAKKLLPNSSAAEADTGEFPLTNTGFLASGIGASNTYIYIAIRRGPMKTPTSGTSVFSLSSRAGTSAVANVSAGFPQDSWLVKNKLGNVDSVDWSFNFFDRLRSNTGWRLSTAFRDAEDTSINFITSYSQNGITLPSTGYTATNGLGYNYIDYFFRRAPGFFDVVCYTGTGANRTVSHNLGVAPELMIVKPRSNSNTEWNVYAAPLGPTKYIYLHANSAASTGVNRWNNTAPTSSVFTVATDTSVNGSGYTLVAYLFATVAGVSKVFSYTGNGSSQTINCGFTGGARFVLIKRTDSTGDWYVWDSARGIVAANDPHLSLNSTAAEVTTDDSVDTDSSGFIVNQVAATNINVNAATYIGLAIA